jgi:hypothetical protein
VIALGQREPHLFAFQKAPRKALTDEPTNDDGTFNFPPGVRTAAPFTYPHNAQRPAEIRRQDSETSGAKEVGQG